MMAIKQLFKAFTTVFEVIGHMGLVAAVLMFIGGFTPETLVQPIPALLVFAGGCLLTALVDDD